jgi:hypothetical protein
MWFAAESGAGVNWRHTKDEPVEHGVRGSVAAYAQATIVLPMCWAQRLVHFLALTGPQYCRKP